MKHFMNLLLWCFSFLLITIKCEGEFENIIHDKPTIHYKSYHFEWNNPEQWLSINNMINTKNDNNIQEIISCTMDIPSLCIYAIPQKPGFQLFYKHLMFDFLNDQNWTQIIVTNNFDIDDIDDIKQHHKNQNIFDIDLYDTQNNNKDNEENPQRRRLRRCRSRRCRRRARLRARRRRIIRLRRSRYNRMRGAIYRARRRSRRQQRMRRTVYKTLYRIGKMLGRSMKNNNFRGIDQRSMREKMRSRMSRFGGGCGNPMMRAQCPTRFATYLGPPHIVGKPSYIVGTPPVGSIIPQMGMMGMGGMGMGGMGGMMGGCGGGRGGKRCRNRRKLINGNGNGNGDRYYDDYGNDMRLEKCVDIKDTEEIMICVTYYYYDRSISLDYNVIERNGDDDDDDDDDKMVEYIKSNIWIWNGDNVNLIECDNNLLLFIGYTICLEQMEDDNDEIFVLIIDNMDNPPVYKLNLMKQENWDKMYEMNDVENHKKICKYILQIEVCFEFKIGDKKIEITAQRILSDKP